MRASGNRATPASGRLSHYKVKPFHLMCLALLFTLSYVLGEVPHRTRASATANRTSSNPGAPQKALLSESISVQASGRGNPSINLSDGREVLTSYEGPEELRTALEQNSARPLSLTSADFDEDGVPDLISGYAGPRSGIVTILRGNVDSLFPNSPEAQRRKAEGAFTDSPFLSPAHAFELPESPDFIGAGDFDADGHWDVVAAARGSNLLYLLRGDGRGRFASPVSIVLPGAITTLATGEMNRADGLADVVVGIVASDGPKLLVFEGPEGALKAAPESFDLPAEAVSLALGQFYDNYAMDVAVAAGNELLIISGRDRKLSLDQSSRTEVTEAKMTRRRFSSALKSVAAGDFTGDYKTDLALLFNDGTVQLLSEKKHRGKKNKGWKSEALNEGSWPQAKQLVRAHVSSLRNDDLVLLDPGDRRLHILAAGAEARRRRGGEGVYASLEADVEPIAVLPMRLNVHARSSLVILNGNHINPSVVLPQAGTTFTVTTAADNGNNSIPTPGSLREAINNANLNPGADMIVFAIGTGLQTIILPAQLPTISDPVTIDGTTQPGFAGTPIIELNGGSGLGLGLDLGAGSSTVRGLVINRCFDGVRIQGNGGNHIEGCFLGTDASGTNSLGNNANGVFILGPPNNTIGGTSLGARNVISGNLRGITIQIGTATNNKVQGNFIGTDVSGTADVGNSEFGVAIIMTTNNLIGGTSAGARNIISGNNQDGVKIFNGAASNQVLGNFIGTDVTGASSLPNGNNGVLIDSSALNTIGGTSSGAGNVISGNSGAGVEIKMSGSSSNLVQGNFIGTNAAGTGPLGNGSSGVVIDASGNIVGATSPNVIAFNGAKGVNIVSGSNLILSNSIHDNTDIGIDLGSDGVTPNDPNDADTGANNLQNFPVLTSANSSGGNTTITGTLNSIASRSFTIEFFSNSACDPSGNGEGQTLIGSTVVMTDGSGNATINATLPVVLSVGQVVTSTASSLSTFDTSEFSSCIAVTPPPCAITCPANITLSSDPGQCSALVSYAVPAASASCAPVTCSPPPGAFFLKGITTVTCSTSSGPGCSFTVTVNDNQAPVITCPSNITATPPPNDSSVRVSYPAPTVTDNCSATSVCSPPSGSFFALGATTVTCTATDTSGNTRACSFTVTVATSLISINDVSLLEGNSGTTDAVFTVTLSKAAALPVTVDFTTSDGTAKAGSDYLSNAGTVIFDPGQVSKSISVQVIGDTSREPDETFFVNLSGATNAGIAVGQGTCTILNDDGPPALSISDASVIEGNSGTVNAVFTVTLSPASGQTVTVNFATADGTATVANNDYVARSGTLTFNPGERSKSIEVQVIGDTNPEPDETFLVKLSGAVNAGILDDTGIGTIINDESPIVADLSISTEVAGSVDSGDQLTYLITISNAGPRLATGVTVVNSIPLASTFSSARSLQGIVTAPNPGTNGAVSWTVSALPAGSQATIEIVINVLAMAGDTLIDTATVGSLSPDPNSGNNSSTSLTTVLGGGVIELAWDPPDPSPESPTPPPRNVRIEGSSTAANSVSPAGVAQAASTCTLIGFKVYLSPNHPVQVIPGNLWRSDLPADTRKVSLPASPAGTFYVVVAVWNCGGTSVDSSPSQEAKSPPLPSVRKIVVTNQIKVFGSNFQGGLRVFIDEVLKKDDGTPPKTESVRFEFVDQAVIKKNGTQIIQRGKLNDGRSIEDLLKPNQNRVSVMIVLQNPDGRMVSIVLPV